MAKLLPESKRRTKVGELPIGESGLIFPYGMVISNNGECFILKDFALYPLTWISNYVMLKIEHTKAGYIAYIYEINYKWLMSDEFILSSSEEYVEVVDFEIKEIYELSEEELVDKLREAEANGDYEGAIKIQEHIDLKRPKLLVKAIGKKVTKK